MSVCYTPLQVYLNKKATYPSRTHLASPERPSPHTSLRLLISRRLLPESTDIPNFVCPLVKASRGEQLLERVQQHYHEPNHKRPDH